MTQAGANDSLAPPPPLSRQLLALAASGSPWRSRISELIQASLPSQARRQVLVIEQVGGQWQTLDGSDQLPDGLTALLAEIADKGAAARSNDWYGAPVGRNVEPVTIVVLKLRAADGVSETGFVESTKDLLPSLADFLSAQRDHDRSVERADRLQRVLEHAANWNRGSGLENLLEQLAKSSCELLDADRASVFLWDKRHQRLVARPALGVTGQVLIVPDDAGVVGQVLHSAEPRRWQAGIGPDEVNRTVDRMLDFETRSLLAVPLLTREGRRLGVFEVLNHVAGQFSAADQELLTELARHAAAAIESTRERDALLASRDALAQRMAGPPPLLGGCPSIVSLRKAISRAAASDLSVLIRGPNGTGKEIVAQQIHAQSIRREHPFVAVNCAAIPESLIDSEFFGHERGAFTDAQQTRAGLFEQASGGTLFLDEIGDLSLAGQAKLLRVLEEQIVVRVGSAQRIAVDVRVLAATNQPLQQRIAEHRFREDLYFRLSVLTLELPPLRERGDDILELAEYFLARSCQHLGRAVPKLSDAARSALMQHAWPGNIRELKNCMERAAHLSEDETLEVGDLWLPQPSAGMAHAGQGLPLAEIHRDANSLADATRDFQIQHIRRTLERCNGNLTEAARRLGLHRGNLYRKMQQLGMDLGPNVRPTR